MQGEVTREVTLEVTLEDAGGGYTYVRLHLNCYA
jgi:hypothetical protein